MKRVISRVDIWCGAFRFHTPSSILVVGPSGCGKTHFTERLLLNNTDLFESPPQAIHYCYGAWQDGFVRMKKGGVIFHEGIPETESLSQWFPQGRYIGVRRSHGRRKWRQTHHQNITVLYLCQDMFPTGKYAKSISRNAHYVVVFKNPRDQLGIRNLLLQSFPTEWKDVLEVFRQTTSRPFGYMVLDLHPASSDDVRLLSHILKDEGWTHCHQKKKNATT